MKSKGHVFVAISGGVDSAVAAAILLEEGYKVTGIYMQTWQDPNTSPSLQMGDDLLGRAKSTAVSLKIPFVSLDIREKFFLDVVKPFIKKYLAGETPNPCLFCNPEVKWGNLQSYALQHGADYFGTGHYARVDHKDTVSVKLLRGFDKTKDQSYVLSMLTQTQLRQSLLPLGTWTKVDVRKKAHALGLSSVDQSESQDLCFINNGDYRDFLKCYASEPIQTGDIVDVDGKILGRHQGLPFYTIGQRKGIRIAAEAPYYVIDKVPSDNLLIVGFAHQTVQQELIAIKPNWISGHPPQVGEVYDVMVRYRANPVPAILSSITGEEFRLKFIQEIRGITPGQVAVLYHEEECLGGGLIKMAC